MLITVDWIAGAIVGLLVLSVTGWLAALYALPETLLRVMGGANLLYACVSFTLAMRRDGDHVPLLGAVAAANMAWAAVCVVLAVLWFGEASVIGVGQLVAEAVFVGGLGVLEWRAAGQHRSTGGRRAVR